MAKLTGRRFSEVAKLAALDGGGGRYLFALRSDGTILRRRTTAPADATYHAWGKKLVAFDRTEACLRQTLVNEGFTIEDKVAERRARIAHERTEAAKQLPDPRSEIKPHECWACRAEAERTPGLMPPVFRMMAEIEDAVEATGAARRYIDDKLGEAHKSHSRSWV